MIRWTDERIIKALRDWEAIFGSPPIAQHWQTADPEGLYPSAWTVRAHFGSWIAAIEAAFPVKVQRRWTKEEVIEALREWGAEHDGLPPTHKELTAGNGLPSFSTVTKLFGSVSAAYLKAGIAPRPIGVNRKAIARYLPLRRETI